jgi:hypothetical protein
MAAKTARKPYVKPVVQKRQRLTDLAEGDNILVSGTITKGGCFSNKR